MKRYYLALIAGVVTATCGSAATAPSTPVDVAVTQLPACATWANTLRAAPAATGSQLTYRNDLYAAGGGVKTIGNKSYAVWFPSNWATTSPRRVVVGLHGTDGNAEEDWYFNWKNSTRDRNWAYIGLTYLNGGVYDDEPAAYSTVKAVIDEVKAACEFGTPLEFLGGFSRGSAMTFGVAYLDLKDRRLFAGFINNSGAWPAGTAMTPTLQGIVTRNETTAFSGGRFWMYCGERDLTHGTPMCDEMTNARTFVTARAGTVGALFSDPTGGHGGLASNATAVAAMYAYLESLR